MPSYTDKGKAGRPSHDRTAIIEELKRRYPNGSEFSKLDDLFEANPDLASKKKTLMNTAKESFGMSLANYFKSIGLLKNFEDKLEEKIKILKERYSDGRPLPKTLDQLKKDNADIPSISTIAAQISQKFPNVSSMDYLIQIGLVRPAGTLCMVAFPGFGQQMPCFTSSKSFKEGNFVTVKLGYAKLTVYGQITKIEEFDSNKSKIPESNIPLLEEVVSKQKYSSSQFESALCINAIGAVGDLLQCYKCSDFTAHKNMPISPIRKPNNTIAICRGLATEVAKVYQYLNGIDSITYDSESIVLIAPGYAEIYVFGKEIDSVVENFSAVKVAIFVEDHLENKAYVAYSKSGYSYINEYKIIGDIDINFEERWTLKHSPSEETFIINVSNNEKYEFPFIDNWNQMNYTLETNGKLMMLEAN